MYVHRVNHKSICGFYLGRGRFHLTLSEPLKAGTSYLKLRSVSLLNNDLIAPRYQTTNEFILENTTAFVSLFPKASPRAKSIHDPPIPLLFRFFQIIRYISHPVTPNSPKMR